jgi:2-oxoglutarate dehydrogenase E2 component (dihydrolipoamide succinyltransferase)
VTEATVAKWLKNKGDAVRADEPIVELETDKVTVEVPAPGNGVLSEIVAAAGSTIAVGAVLGLIGEGAGTASAGVRPRPRRPPPRRPRRRQPGPRPRVLAPSARKHRRGEQDPASGRRRLGP